MNDAGMTVVDVLIELGQRCELFPDESNEAYAQLRTGTHSEFWQLRSKTFREWLAGKYFLRTGKGASRKALTDALYTLAATAKFGGAPARAVSLRVAGDERQIVIDLGDRHWSAVTVTPAGWKLGPSPVPFCRTPRMLALPQPVPGGDLRDLWRFLNVPEHERLLVLAWLVAALWPRSPYPLLVVQGEQGCGKSTLTKLLRDLTDPSDVPVRSPPREDRDFVVGCLHNRVVAFDNLSGLQPWLADGLCRLSTGGGHAARALYTDADEVVLKLERPAIMNGIDDVATRPDLADRALLIHPEPLGDDRQTESELFAKWSAARPAMFGALLTALSGAMRELAGVRLSFKPRMLDFARLAVAAEPYTGLPVGSFMRSYEDNLSRGMALGIESSPIAPGIITMMAMQNEWVGSPSELLTILTKSAAGSGAADAHNWPNGPRALSNELRRIATALRAAGIDVLTGEAAGRASSARRIVLRRRSPLGISSSLASLGLNGHGHDLAGHGHDLDDHGHDANDADDEPIGAMHAPVLPPPVQAH